MPRVTVVRRGLCRSSKESCPMRPRRGGSRRGTRDRYGRRWPDDGGAVDQGPDDCQYALGVSGGRPVELVDHDEVGEGEMPVDLGMPGAGVVELGGVDDLDEAAVDDAVVRWRAPYGRVPAVRRVRWPPRRSRRCRCRDGRAGRGTGRVAGVAPAQHRQPFPRETVESPSAPATAMASIPMAPKSLTMAPIRVPPLRRRR